LSRASSSNLAVQGDLPVELRGVVERDLAVGLLEGRGPHARAHAEPVQGAGPGPPLGEQGPEARLLERRGGAGEEVVRAARVERVARGLARAQALLDARAHAGGLGQGRQERLVHIRAFAGEGGGLASPGDPGVRSGDQQARVVDALQQIADVPTPLSGARQRATAAVARAATAPRAGLLARCARLLEAEAEPEGRPGRGVERLPPGANLLDERLELLGGAAHLPVREVEGGEPAVVDAAVGDRCGLRRFRAGSLRTGVDVGAHDLIHEGGDESCDELAGRMLRCVPGRLGRECTRGGRHAARQLLQLAGVASEPDRLPARHVVTVA
jgi:hypothetical protein